jgi:hypothetical protein
MLLLLLPGWQLLSQVVSKVKQVNPPHQVICTGIADTRPCMVTTSAAIEMNYSLKDFVVSVGQGGNS